MQPTDWWAEWDQRDDPAALIPQVLARRAVFPRYQPIMDLATRTVVGVEALARGPAGSPIEFPDVLFAAAARAGLLPLLDQLCAARAMEVARDAGDLAPPLLFVNAEPTALNTPLTPDLVAVINSDRRYRIVLEFTERALGHNPAALLNIANGVHRGSGALALDDVGADPVSLAFLPLVEPEVVKLDLDLLRHPHAPATIETAATVGAYAEQTGAVVLAEGIETEEDLVTARALGARWGQGWLFGRPGPLTAIAGWPVHRSARLRPPQPELHLPAGTPFSVAAVRHHPRAGDRAMVDALTGYLLSLASNTGPYAVVLGAYPDPATGRDWLRRLEPVADTAAFVGVTGPAVTDANPRAVRLATAPAGTETVLAVVGPQATAALCARPAPREADERDEPDAGVEFVLTHERNLVLAVARMLLGRMGTAAERLHEPIVDRLANPRAVAR